MSSGGENIISQESLGVSTDELYRNSATDTTVSEANIAPNSGPELIQPYVDAKAFAAVPEHGGSLQETLERLKNNPNAPLPSCIKDLGFTSTTQLIERLEGRDDPTKRAPTVRELKAAKEIEALKQKSTVNSVPKAIEKTTKPTPNNNIQNKTIEVTPTPPDTESKAPNITTSQAPQEEFLVVSTEPEHTITETTTVENAGSSPPEILPQVRVAEDVIREQIPVTEVEPVRTAIIVKEQSPITHHADQISSILPSPISDKPFTATDEAPTFQYTPEDTIDSEGVFLSHDTEHVETMAIEPALEQVFTQPLDQLDEAYPHISDLTNSIIDHELPEYSEFQLAEISSDEFDLEITLDTDIYPATFTDEALEPTSLENEHVETPSELQSYIATLVPGKAEAAEPVIHALAETLKLHEQTDKSEVKTVAAQIQEVEKLFVDLLEALGIQHSDQSVEKLLRTVAPELLTLNVSAHPNEISINLRNYLGTHEHKLASTMNPLNQLIKTAREKLKAHLQLGKHALSGSMA